jgi:hypothetical protein
MANGEKEFHPYLFDKPAGEPYGQEPFELASEGNRAFNIGDGLTVGEYDWGDAPPPGYQVGDLGDWELAYLDVTAGDRLVAWFPFGHFNYAEAYDTIDYRRRILPGENPYMGGRGFSSDSQYRYDDAHTPWSEGYSLLMTGTSYAVYTFPTATTSTQIKEAYENVHGEAYYGGKGLFGDFTGQDGGWSKSFWIKPSGQGPTARLLTQGNTIESGQMLYYDTGFKALPEKGGSPSVEGNFKLHAPMAVSSSTWYNIIESYDSSSGYLYVNGGLKDSVDLGRAAAMSQKWVFGQNLAASNPAGHVADWRFYSGALSAAEVSAIYGGGTGDVDAAHEKLSTIGWSPVEYSGFDRTP